MDLDISCNTPSLFFSQLAASFNAEIVDGRFEVPSQYGEGYARFVTLEEGLMFSVYEMKLKDAVFHERQKKQDWNHFGLSCSYATDSIQKWINNKWADLDRHSSNGLFLLSPDIQTKFRVPANTPVSQLVIIFTKDWLEKNLLQGRPSMLLDYIQQEKSFCFYEGLHLEMRRLADKILAIDYDQALTGIYLKSYILEFLGHFIEKIESGDRKELSFQRIGDQDVERIFYVKKQLEDRYSKAPAIEDLAKEAGMSRSKLQKLFKHVMGQSIYQYVLRIKMLEAQKLLDSGRYSVSEVGYKIGYSNLSHFTDAFKKQFGLNPKAYLHQK